MRIAQIFLPPLVAAAGSLLLTCAALADPPMPAADRTDKFLRDYAETRGFSLGRPVNPTPTPDGSAVLFLRAKSAREPSQELYEFNVATRETRLLLSPEDALRGGTESLTPEEKARRERQRISVGGFTSFSISKDSRLVLLSLSGKLYVLDRTKRVAREIATGPGTVVDPKFSPDSLRVAYVRNQDVCVFDLATGKETAVTTGGTETLSHGLAEFVAQEEMERFSGYWWSPDSRRIVYQESDASQVETWYVADPSNPGGEPVRSFYPRPGKDNVSVRLGVVFIDAPGETVWLDWDHVRYPYLGKVSWDEEGPLTLTVLSRDQTDLTLLRADPTWGETTALLTEHDDAWVNLDQDMPRWLAEADGGGFLWTTERNGRWELERHHATGGLDRPLTAHAPYGHFVAVADGATYYVADDSFLDDLRPGAAWDMNVWKISLRDLTDSPHPAAATMRAGVIGARAGENSQIFVVQRQSAEELATTEVHRFGDMETVGTLPSTAESPTLLPSVEYAMTTPSEGSPEFRAVVVRPRRAAEEPARRWPVLVDVYGGPSHQQATHTLRPYLLDQWLADQGFIVVAIDGHGTPGRGRDWERAIAGHFGSVPLDDQVAALQALGKTHPEMDLERVGITGWSFGGYMAALAVLRRPDVFKAAVAGAPVADWLDYDTCYTERYLGVPGAGRWPDAYREGSLLTYAGGLSRPLLVIHGTADDNVYLRHSLRLIGALFSAGKTADFLPLSNFTHMVPDPVIRTRLEERITTFFRKHLGCP